jgi:Ca2+-transporting ATPase
MRRPPYRPGESVFARGLGWRILWTGALMAVLSLGAGYGYWKAGDPKWQTVVFTTLTVAQMTHVLAVRSERESLFRIGLLSNKPLLLAVLLTVGLQVAAIYLPLLQTALRTQALAAGDLALCAGLSLLVLVAVEVEKRTAAPREPQHRR